MKQSIFFSAAILFLSVFSFQTLMAQAPEAMFYQAEARDAEGHSLKNKRLKVKITILAEGIRGEKVWEATHNVVTDQFGMFDLIIGEGESGRYNFSKIEWGHHAHFLNVQVLYKNRWNNMGTSPFMSVPYALDAKRVEQRAFDNLDVSESITVGNGLEISKIFEITGTTHATNNTIRFKLPEGSNSINTRVLDVAIYKYGMVGEGGYYGQGYEHEDKTVGYTLWHSDQMKWYYLILNYPDMLKGQPFRAVLMQVENSTVIGM